MNREIKFRGKRLDNCVYKGPLELMDPAGVEKTGEEVDEQLIKLLQSDKEELKRWIKRMKYHCNKVNELRIELNKYQKLLKRIESSPKMPIERWTGDEREIICPACKSYICYPEDIKTIDLKYRQFCGACGQKLNWERNAGLPVFTQELYDSWMEIQDVRNEALIKAKEVLGDE